MNTLNALLTFNMYNFINVNYSYYIWYQKYHFPNYIEWHKRKRKTIHTYLGYTFLIKEGLNFINGHRTIVDVEKNVCVSNMGKALMWVGTNTHLLLGTTY